MTRKPSRRELSNTTQASLLFLREDLLTSQEQLLSFLPSPISAHLSTLGTDGGMSQMDLIDTLRQCYDTLSKKEQMILWTLIVDFLTLGTPHGMRSRELNSIFSQTKDN